MCFFVQTNHTRKELLFLMFKEINLRNHSSLHKLFYSLNWYKPEEINPVLVAMKKDNLIRYGDTLLSEPELDFYYYICNSKKFTNGLDLRNKYSHSNSTLSEKENESNFYIVLLILIQLIIRINGELCWYDEQKLDKDCKNNYN